MRSERFLIVFIFQLEELLGWFFAKFQPIFLAPDFYTLETLVLGCVKGLLRFKQANLASAVV